MFETFLISPDMNKFLKSISHEFQGPSAFGFHPYCPESQARRKLWLSGMPPLGISCLAVPRFLVFYFFGLAFSIVFQSTWWVHACKKEKISRLGQNLETEMNPPLNVGCFLCGHLWALLLLIPQWVGIHVIRRGQLEFFVHPRNRIGFEDPWKHGCHHITC